MGKTLTSSIKKYFWGDDLTQLNWPVHKKYITQTLLEKGDPEAVNWLFGRADKTDIKQLLPSLKLSPKSTNFWNIYLS